MKNAHFRECENVIYLENGISEFCMPDHDTIKN